MTLECINPEDLPRPETYTQVVVGKRVCHQKVCCARKQRKPCLCLGPVTGLRSNQLNYVPSLFSSGSGKPLNFLFFSSVHRVARLNRFHPIVPNSGVLSTGNRKEVHPDAS